MGVAVLSAQTPLTPSALREHPQIAYSKTPPRDPVALLNARLESGDVRLQHDGRQGFLTSVLAALDIPIDSQLLVFSKTSFQAPRINPANPRALYFNDTVSVGWVRGGEVLEFAAQDPTQGTIFYTLEQSSSTPPRFTRQASCVQCHTSEATLDVPGMFMNSVYPDPKGTPLYFLLFNTDHRTPFETRWGGWYVTGRHSGRHLGNAVAHDTTSVESMVTNETVNVQRLDGRFETTAYPEPGSDVVALLVMEHQMRMLNLMTRVGWEARVGAEAAGRPPDQAVDELVDYMLFVDEAELPGPVSGTSTFADTFAKRGPRDAQGRSLRDLDLTERLFRYPCSYLIYSEPFDALPDAARTKIYARMFAILSGRDVDARYQHLSEQDRRAVLDILVKTKKGLPSYFAGGDGTIPAGSGQFPS